MRHRCRLRHLALCTEHAYVGWIRRFILFHHKRHPLEMGANEVSAFLTHLAVARRVAASTQIYIHVLKLNGFAVRSPADRMGQSTAAHAPG